MPHQPAAKSMRIKHIADAAFLRGARAYRNATGFRELLSAIIADQRRQENVKNVLTWGALR